MKCLSCSADVPEASKFCIECGAAVRIACPACRHPTLPGAKFCAECGANLRDRVDEPVRTTASSDTPTAERRQVTILFCDLVGSTELASRLDPEDLREVFSGYHACVAQTVSSFVGFVAKYMGDGVLVYFGYPHAHEDDVEQAVRAGLALINAVGELQAPQRLQVRIGIATGLVVVGDLIGAGSAQEQAIVGETPNLAARLQALAEPNSIVISESTRRQVGALFELVDLGPQSLKGFAEPQRAWRVLAENRALGRFEAMRSGVTPLVGRDEEMELLVRRWSQATSGSGRVVLISADPGIGKSRLAEALAERISAEPHIRLRYFCSPHHQDSALYPVIAQMERAAGFARNDAPEARLRKLVALLAQSRATEEETALIAALLSVPNGERYRMPDMSPQRRKEKTLQALLVQSERLSAKQPMLMIFEDAHWIDPTLLELLTLTVERRDVPALLLITARPEFTPPWPAHAHVTTLPLTRLDRQDTAAIVANIAGNRALSPDIVREIADRTDGVPLFAEELTKAVLESGAQGAAALSAVPHSALSVPATLHASLMARLDRLGWAAKDVAQKGAVIGREFGHELLASVADRSEPELREALDQLTNSGLLFVRGTPPQSTYIFKHALVQDAAYSTLLRGRRQQLHARIAEALEAQFPENAKSQPELLAHHFTEATQAEPAIDYWLKAGQHALSRSGMAEAEALLRKGLNLLLSLPDTVWRQEHELDLQIALGQTLVANQGFGSPAAGDAVSRARQLCDTLSRPDKVLPILLGQWMYHINSADLLQGQRFAAEIRQLSEMRDDVITRALACQTSGFTSLHLGDVTAARVYLEQALVLYDPSQQHLPMPWNPVSRLPQVLSLAQAYCGLLDQARSRSDAALAEARHLSHAHELALQLSFASRVLRLTRSNPTALLQQADELFALSDEKGFPIFRAVGLSFRGWGLVISGHAAQGIPLLTAGVADLRATGSTLGLPGILAMLADAYRVAGQPQIALAHLVEAERFAKATQVKINLADTHRLKGDLLMQTGDRIAAEASFHDAIALAREQGAKLFELRSSTSLARLWRDQGKRTEARELLAPVYNWFTEGFDAPDLVEAKALLDKLAIGEPNGSSALSLTRDRD